MNAVIDLSDSVEASSAPTWTWAEVAVVVAVLATPSCSSDVPFPKAVEDAGPFHAREDLLEVVVAWACGGKVPPMALAYRGWGLPCSIAVGWGREMVP